MTFKAMYFKRYTYLVHHELTASVTLTVENLEVVSLKSGTRQGYLLSAQLFNDCS